MAVFLELDEGEKKTGWLPLLVFGRRSQPAIGGGSWGRETGRGAFPRRIRAGISGGLSKGPGL
jgi:hypothetical protein